MRYIVVGSGVAGVCCLRALTERLQPGDEVTIVTPGDAVKVSSLRGLWLS